MKYKVTTSCHDMPCIEVQDIEVEEMKRLKDIVSNPFMDSEEYLVSKKAGAFLQGYDENHKWLLIEFWNHDYQDFVNFINKDETRFEVFNAVEICKFCCNNILQIEVDKHLIAFDIFGKPYHINCK